jgi:hypothetical protein
MCVCGLTQCVCGRGVKGLCLDKGYVDREEGGREGGCEKPG